MISARPDGDSVRRGDGQPKRDPSALRMLLGVQLRRRREAAGISRETAGAAIGASYAKIRRLELGDVGCKERDVAALFTLYGVDEQGDREALLALTQQANGSSWWRQYGEVLPSWYEQYILGLEQAASLVRSYAAQTVPTMFQTEDYARALAESGDPGGSSEAAKRQGALRRAWQELLTRPDAPQVWAVVGRVAFSRSIRSPQVLRGQVQYLLTLMDLPNISLQIAPEHSEGHAATGGSFTILRFSDYNLPDVVCIQFSPVASTWTTEKTSTATGRS